jgi:hypothetical protein
MIEGFKLTVPGTQIIEAAKKRVEFHEKKAKRYDAIAAKIKETAKELPDDVDIDELTAVNTISNKRINSAKDQLTHSAEYHRKQARFFVYVSLHIETKQTYLLTQRELQEYEILE